MIRGGSNARRVSPWPCWFKAFLEEIAMLVTLMVIAVLGMALDVFVKTA